MQTAAGERGGTRRAPSAAGEDDSLAAAQRQREHEGARQREHPDGHELTVTIPLDRAADLIVTPLAAAGRVLSARGGLPVYVGLGVMAAADVVAWPVAVAAGLGYAALRRWGPFGRPPGTPADGHDAARRPDSARRAP